MSQQNAVSAQQTAQTGTTVSRRNNKPGAVFQADRIEQSQGAINRLIAGFLWIITLLGEIIAFTGGWDLFFKQTWDWQQWNWKALVIAVPAAVPVQLLCTWVQYAFARKKSSWQYRTAIIFSSGPSLFTYFPPIWLLCASLIPDVVPTLVGQGLVAIVVLVVVLASDIIPETLMVAD